MKGITSYLNYDKIILKKYWLMKTLYTDVKLNDESNWH